MIEVISEARQEGQEINGGKQDLMFCSQMVEDGVDICDEEPIRTEVTADCAPKGGAVN